MRSIRTRFMALTLTAILVSVVTVGAISFASLRKESEDHATEVMHMICDERRVTINDYLKQVETSMEIVSNFAIGELNTVKLAVSGLSGVDGMGGKQVQLSPEKQAALDEYLHEYLRRVEDVLYSAANHNDGIETFYYRLNPEISTQEKGFSYSRVTGRRFRKIEMMDLAPYSQNGEEQADWFYIPLRNGGPMWIEPKDSGEPDVKTISYVLPVYKENTFIGVIGAEISYGALIGLIRDIRLYRTDYALLMEQDGTIVYHPLLRSGSRLVESYPELAEAVELMGGEDSNTTPVRYTHKEQDWQLFFSTISSGQKLVVTAPVAEINEGWQQLGTRFVIALLGILVLFAAITFATVRRITNPLKRLTEASQSIADGNYNVQLMASGNDEVGTLTRAFQQLVSHLKIYINDLNSMAYRDAMTGVKNKAAYGISAQKLNDLIRMSDRTLPPKFAFIMFDCNELKRINDTYGHEKGDIYLRTACKLICNVFTHSPVFRMGGDEFAVLLTEAAYEERELLLHDFDRQTVQRNAAALEPWEFVRIAKGMAVYDPKIDPDVEHVLRRADEAMYENKRKSKAAQLNG